MSNPVPIGEKVEMEMEHECEGYSAGHPWYYLRGGRRLSLKEIRESVRARGYRGYLADDIAKADNMCEPQRSEALRAMRAEAVADLKCDVSRYRKLSLDLVRRREAGLDKTHDGCCADIHTSLSLKHNHIYNAFAHLVTLDGLLEKQGDLFGL